MPDCTILRFVTSMLHRTRVVVTDDHYFGDERLGSSQRVELGDFPVTAIVRIGKREIGVSAYGGDSHDAIKRRAVQALQEVIRDRRRTLESRRWRRDKAQLRAEAARRGWEWDGWADVAIDGDGRRYLSMSDVHA